MILSEGVLFAVALGLPSDDRISAQEKLSLAAIIGSARFGRLDIYFLTSPMEELL
jgi:hypothetical protein